MKPVGKPDAGNPHVRFDERGGETGLGRRLNYRASPRLYRRWAASATLVDTLGLLLNVFVAAGDVQDRDAAIPLLCRTRRLFPFIERILADGGYRGREDGRCHHQTRTLGRKRHILVDTLGLLLNVFVAAGDVQDRDAAIPLLCRTRRLFPFIERIFADGGYQGERTANAVTKTGAWKLEIVKRSDLHRFVVLPKRWIVTVCTMLPSWALSGHQSSSAVAASGDRCSSRQIQTRTRVNLPQATQRRRKV